MIAIGIRWGNYRQSHDNLAAKQDFPPIIRRGAGRVWPLAQAAMQPNHKESVLIGVFVTFHYEADFDEQATRKIAETARARFEGMPGLRSKAFTLNAARREATNFYVWDSEEAARGFFTPALTERVAGLYGVRPTVEFVQIAALVENAGA